ncbi:hypothetical protein EAH68_07250 [Corynebacterium hylobatis]|uniref:Uncharacterized protein n=1 Tax=Corynebacterium hylobatis TaxID=1859290 RepID=A0A430HY12_9CORY|nr:hypothetical protein [Corynebacterium hylobatis]RSZ63458.1 hypothetical protein EAH68_07250 [Corynebacterium hylobatis]
MQKTAEEARVLLAEFQAEQQSPHFFGTNFPRGSLEQIRDSTLEEDERQRLITYLLGHWYLDQVEGDWAYVPMLVDKPSLYLSFGLGIRTEQGSMINIAESAREILEGADLGFKEAFYTASVKVEQRGGR